MFEEKLLFKFSRIEVDKLIESYLSQQLRYNINSETISNLISKSFAASICYLYDTLFFGDITYRQQQNFQNNFVDDLLQGKLMNVHKKESIGGDADSMIPMKQMQGLNLPNSPKQLLKKPQKYAYFNEANKQLQFSTPIMVRQQLYRAQSHDSKRINPNKHQNLVLKSIDKFLQKKQNFDRQIINSSNIRSTIINSKSKNKNLFESQNQFLEFFQQTMLQLKQLLKDVTSLVSKVKEMLAQGAQQISKFQKNLKTSASYSRIQQGINNINSLQKYNAKLPFTTNKNSSIPSERSMITPRVQTSEQQKGKIIRNHKKKLGLSHNKSSKRYEKPSQMHCRRDINKYEAVNFNDISQTTAKMRKLLDLL